MEDLQPTHYSKGCFLSCHTVSVIKETPTWFQLKKKAWYVLEVDSLIKLAVVKETVVSHLYAKKTENACYVVQLAGEIRCAALIILRSSLVSATFLTGFLKIWLVGFACTLFVIISFISL